jgi:hypothetical protein
MIHAFSAALGLALCALGVIGLGVSSSFTDAVEYRTNVIYDFLCILTGIVALMGTAERDRVTRRFCMAAAAAHTGIVVLALIEITTVNPLFAFGTSDLCVSSSVVTSCLAAVWRLHASLRPGQVQFDARLPSAKTDLADAAGIVANPLPQH